jgi:hypothetical protein
MYNVSVKRNIELDYEEADNLMAQILQADFGFISNEINELIMKRSTTPVEIEDFKNNIEVRDAMKRLMRYYMKQSDYMEFMELQRVYGNV